MAASADRWLLLGDSDRDEVEVKEVSSFSLSRTREGKRGATRKRCGDDVGYSQAALTCTPSNASVCGLSMR